MGRNDRSGKYEAKTGDGPWSALAGLGELSEEWKLLHPEERRERDPLSRRVSVTMSISLRCLEDMDSRAQAKGMARGRYLEELVAAEKKRDKDTD